MDRIPNEAAQGGRRIMLFEAWTPDTQTGRLGALCMATRIVTCGLFDAYQGCAAPCRSAPRARCLCWRCDRAHGALLQRHSSAARDRRLPEELARVRDHTVDPDLEVHMGPGRASG